MPDALGLHHARAELTYGHAAPGRSLHQDTQPYCSAAINMPTLDHKIIAVLTALGLLTRFVMLNYPRQARPRPTQSRQAFVPA